MSKIRGCCFRATKDTQKSRAPEVSILAGPGLYILQAADYALPGEAATRPLLGAFGADAAAVACHRNLIAAERQSRDQHPIARFEVERPVRLHGLPGLLVVQGEAKQAIGQSRQRRNLCGHALRHLGFCLVIPRQLSVIAKFIDRVWRRDT